MLQVARLAPNLLQEAAEPVARFLSEQFNDWPEGSREAAVAASEAAGLAYSDPSE